MRSVSLLLLFFAGTTANITVDFDSGASIGLNFDAILQAETNICTTMTASGDLKTLDVQLPIAGNSLSSFTDDSVITISDGYDCLQVSRSTNSPNECPKKFTWPTSSINTLHGYVVSEVDVSSAGLGSEDETTWEICIKSASLMDSSQESHVGTLELIGLTCGVTLSPVTTPSPTAAESATPSPTAGESATPSPTAGESATPSPTAGESATPSPTAAESATPSPSSSPTMYPTESVSEHIYVRAVDVHGDGWGDDIYLSVASHLLSEPIYFSLSCACKVIRLPAGDMELSIYRNTTGPHAPYEWEVLWTAGYSDGLTETPFDVYGDMDTVLRISDWHLVDVRKALDTNVDAPKNKCHPPPPKASASSKVAGNSSTHAPPPLVNVRLALYESSGNGWCDDSGDVHEVACFGEADAAGTFPNLLTYPRYFVSDAEGRKLLQQGTMRVDNMNEEVQELKFPREGLFVFSVSGHYGSHERRRSLSESTLSWDFCGKQGGIGERLHFNIEHGVCKPHYIEQVNEAECEELTSMRLVMPIESLSASESLTALRGWIHVGVLMAAVLMVMALALFVAKRRQPLKLLTPAANAQPRFVRLDTSEHDMKI